MKFYGFSPISERGLNFNLNRGLTFQEVAHRVKETPFFVGANYLFFSNKATFNTELDLDLDNNEKKHQYCRNKPSLAMGY